MIRPKIKDANELKIYKILIYFLVLAVLIVICILNAEGIK